jgi:hypothetical protein
VYDSLGSYKVAWLSFGGVALVGMILVFTVPPVRDT